MYKQIIIFAIGIFLITAAIAQKVEFQATAPAEVAVGERFRVTFQLNKRPTDFSAPAFSGFRVLSGPNQSSSTSMQIINNQTTIVESHGYTYILEALQEGTFTIDAARATAEGSTHRSNTLKIVVRAGSASTAPSPSGQPQQSIPPAERASDKDVFIRAVPSTNSPYQGQQVIITYYIYTRVSINQYSINKLPSYRSFWTENLTAQGQPQTTTQVIDGETYRVAEIYRVAVFPQRSGELPIEPLETELVISLPGQRRQSLLDEFFGGSPFDQRRNIRQDVSSNAVTLKVKPLPTQNRPSTFSGMVGTEFDVKASVNITELRVNDAANLRLTISGRGNMKMLEKPSLMFPHNLEVFDPTVMDNINNTTSGVSGSRSYEYVMIPRTGGEFTIPSWNFVYFDPLAERYVNKEIPEFVLQVSGEGTTAGSASGAATQESIRTLATDIRFIKLNTSPLMPRGEYFYGSNVFWIMLILPFLLFSFFVVYWRNHIRLQGNYELLKTRKAEKMARRRLKKAKMFLDKKQEIEFYDEIFQTLWGYLSDKLSIPVSILNKETVEGAFKAKRVPTELSEAFISAINDCEYARFAPGMKEDRMAEIYRKSFDTIIMLERDLKNKKV